MKKTLLIATTNTGKQAELIALLKDSIDTLYVPRDVSISLHVNETGSTYAANAYLKSAAYCKASGIPSLADDSGLEVESLGGAPGLFSARFSPKANAGDADRRTLLINKLIGSPKPWKARFVCAMALVLPDGRTFQSQGFCDGEIIPDERGKDGFGYDPIFLCTEIGRTMAELTMEEKNRISHRAKAMQAMIALFHTVFS